MTVTKRWLLCILLSLFALLSAIGYAKTASNLLLSGDVGAMPKPFSGVYIADVKIHYSDGVSSPSFEYTKPTNLQTSVIVNKQNASITYEVLVHNNTDVTYWYLGTEILPEYGKNSLIGTSNSGIRITTKDNSSSNSTLFDTDDWVPPQTYRTFYVTYTFGANAQGRVDLMVNYEFGLHMGSVQDAFLRVLNDKVSDYGYAYLVQAFEERYRATGSTVIGNLGAEEDVFDNLFGSNLTIDVNGVATPVTILVERQNVDKSTNSGDTYSANSSLKGCEYTVYITVDDLATGKPTVYAVSYSCGADGVWYQIGELYEGKCDLATYLDTETNKNLNAFNVDSWLATQNDYRVTDDITYKVGYAQGTEYDKLLTIEQLMSTNDQEFYNKINNNSGKLLKPVCLILYRYQHNGGSYLEYENEQNRYKDGYTALKAAFDRVKPYCLIANGAQEVKIQNANSLSRARLIQLLEDIQMCYDYYLSVNPNG